MRFTSTSGRLINIARIKLVELMKSYCPCAIAAHYEYCYIFFQKKTERAKIVTGRVSPSQQLVYIPHNNKCDG